jgi:hypothetical protein
LRKECGGKNGWVLDEEYAKQMAIKMMRIGNDKRGGQTVSRISVGVKSGRKQGEGFPILEMKWPLGGRGTS